MKRRAVEISERRLSPEEKKQFDQAKAIEVNNFMSAKAFEGHTRRGHQYEMDFET